MVIIFYNYNYSQSYDYCFSCNSYCIFIFIILLSLLYFVFVSKNRTKINKKVGQFMVKPGLVRLKFKIYVVVFHMQSLVKIRPHKVGFVTRYPLCLLAEAARKTHSKNNMFIKHAGIWTWDLSRKLRHVKKYTKTCLKTQSG